MQPRLLRLQFRLCFNIIRIGNTAIYRADSRALRFLVKPGAFGTLSGYDIIKFIRHGLLSRLGILLRSILKLHSFKLGASGPIPLSSTLVNGSIRAFRLARATVDTFVRYNYRHFSIFEPLKKRCKNTARLSTIKTTANP